MQPQVGAAECQALSCSGNSSRVGAAPGLCCVTTARSSCPVQNALRACRYSREQGAEVQVGLVRSATLPYPGWAGRDDAAPDLRSAMVAHMQRLRLAADHHRQARALAACPPGTPRAAAFLEWTNRRRPPGSAEHPPTASLAGAGEGAWHTRGAPGAPCRALGRAASTGAEPRHAGEGAEPSVQGFTSGAPLGCREGPGGPAEGGRLRGLCPRWSTGGVAGGQAGCGSPWDCSDAAAHVSSHTHPPRGAEEVVLPLSELSRRRATDAPLQPLQWRAAADPGRLNARAMQDAAGRPVQEPPAASGPTMLPPVVQPGVNGDGMMQNEAQGPHQGLARGAHEPTPDRVSVSAAPSGRKGEGVVYGESGRHQDPGHGADMEPKAESVSLLVAPPGINGDPPGDRSHAQDPAPHEAPRQGPRAAGGGVMVPRSQGCVRGCIAGLAAFWREDPGRHVLHRRSNLAIAAGLAALTALWIALAVQDARPEQAARCAALARAFIKGKVDLRATQGDLGLQGSGQFSTQVSGGRRSQRLGLRKPCKTRGQGKQPIAWHLLHSQD